MSEVISISRRRLIFAAFFATIGVVSQGIRLAQGERSIFVIIAFVAFLLMLPYIAWPLYQQLKDSE
jgi:Na+/glutamate symporter